jgi:hypothetical protein
VRLLVVIERVNAGSQRDGVLIARVMQDGKLGKNLLSERSLTNIEHAKIAVEQKLEFALSHIGVRLDVEFEMRYF